MMHNDIKRFIESWTYKRARQLKSCLFDAAMRLPIRQFPTIRNDVVAKYAHCSILDLGICNKSLSKKEESDLCSAMTDVLSGNNTAISMIFDSYRESLYEAGSNK